MTAVIRLSPLTGHLLPSFGQKCHTVAVPGSDGLQTPTSPCSVILPGIYARWGKRGSGMLTLGISSAGWPGQMHGERNSFDASFWCLIPVGRFNHLKIHSGCSLHLSFVCQQLSI